MEFKLAIKNTQCKFNRFGMCIKNHKIVDCVKENCEIIKEGMSDDLKGVVRK